MFFCGCLRGTKSSVPRLLKEFRFLLGVFKNPRPAYAILLPLSPSPRNVFLICFTYVDNRLALGPNVPYTNRSLYFVRGLGADTRLYNWTSTCLQPFSRPLSSRSLGWLLCLVIQQVVGKPWLKNNNTFWVSPNSAIIVKVCNDLLKCNSLSHVAGWPSMAAKIRCYLLWHLVVSLGITIYPFLHWHSNNPS